MSRPKKLAPDHEIIKRRTREDAQASLEGVRRQNEQWGNVANWEIKTTGRILTQEARLRSERLREDTHVRLVERRKMLAMLLHTEQGQLEEEYRNSFETAEQRRQRLSERARMLKQQREDKRIVFAEEALKRRQRLQQDEMRLAQSQLRTRAVARARGSQLEERAQQRDEQKREEEAFAREWEASRIAKKEREDIESKVAGRRNQEMKEMLDFQVHDRDERIALARAQLEEERASSRASWAREVEDEGEQKLEKAKLQYVERMQVQEANQLRSHQREEEKSRESDLDCYLLQMQLDKDAADQAREDENKGRVKQAAIDFQRHLKDLAVKEAKDDSSNEAVRIAQQEKVWKKRQDQWDREAEERANLMKTVNETRRVQIEEKIRIAARQKQEDSRWTERAVMESKVTDEAERVKALAMRKQKVDNQALIWQQMKQKEEGKRVTKQLAYLEDKRAKAYTKKFNEDIEAMRQESITSGHVYDNFPKRKTGLW